MIQKYFIFVFESCNQYKTIKKKTNKILLSIIQVLKNMFDNFSGY